MFSKSYYLVMSKYAIAKNEVIAIFGIESFGI